MTDSALATMAEQARHAAEAAAARAGAEVRALDDIEDIHAVASAFGTIWEARDMDPPVRSDLLRAFTHVGNYVVGLFVDGRVCGGSVGFLYGDREALALHSHISGVLPELQGRNAGFALKQHQRAWALARDIDLVSWTFDPLVRRNAYFNLTKLGAELTEFRPDFYGAMSDGINSGDRSDRGIVAWHLTADRVRRASEGHQDVVDEEALRASGAEVVLSEGAGGEPRVAESSAPARLCWVPPDILSLRAADAQAGAAWRLALRSSLGFALDDGLRCIAMTRSGWYVLSKES